MWISKTLCCLVEQREQKVSKEESSQVAKGDEDSTSNGKTQTCTSVPKEDRGSIMI
jgi:hypothetical protein